MNPLRCMIFGYGFEWIDLDAFLLAPFIIVGERTADYEAVAKIKFDELGWAGDGDINLLWLRPFVFPLELGITPFGVVIWHVKHDADGISYMLLPIALPFEEFRSFA